METQENQNKQIEGPNQREKIKKLHPIPLPMKVLFKNENKNDGELCDTKSKLEQGSIINEAKISRVNVLLINNI